MWPAVIKTRLLTLGSRASQNLLPCFKCQKFGHGILNSAKDNKYVCMSVLWCVWSTLSTPPWLLHCPQINYSLHSLHKDDTAPEIFRHNFNELCADYNHFTRLYTDGSKMGDGIDLAVVWQKSCKTVRLPNNASIFGAMLCAISLVLNIIRHWRDMDLSSSLTLCLVCRLRAGLNSK